jgi:hypothetical protein
MQLARACHTGGREARRHCKELSVNTACFVSVLDQDSLGIKYLFAVFCRWNIRDGCLAPGLAKTATNCNPCLGGCTDGVWQPRFWPKIDRVQSCRQCSPTERLPCFVPLQHRCAILDIPQLARLCLRAIRFLMGFFFCNFRNFSLLPTFVVFFVNAPAQSTSSPDIGHGINC